MNLDLFIENDINWKIKKVPYRIPYMGSKQLIAERLMTAMLKHKPQAKYFYDLFGGGGSMSFMALQFGLQVVYNEKQTSLVDFINYIINRIKNNEKSKFGLFPEEFYNFVTKEEFLKQITLDTLFSQFCKICYSFGNNQRNYLFNSDIEEYKKNGHNLVIFQDLEAKNYIKEYYKNSCFKFIDIIDTKPTWQERRMLFVDIIMKIEAIKIVEEYKSGFVDKFNNLTSEQFYTLKQSELCKIINEYAPDIPKKTSAKRNNLERLQGFKQLSQLQQLVRLNRLEEFKLLSQLEQLERLISLDSLQKLKQIDKFVLHNLDYKDVPINTPIEETIIYLDPPYQNTATYIEGQEFDYKELYSWFINSPYTCFMSEYNAPFKCIFELEKRGMLNGASNFNKTEKLFINMLDN